MSLTYNCRILTIVSSLRLFFTSSMRYLGLLQTCP